MAKHSDLADSGNQAIQLDIRLIKRSDLMEVLEVYRQCEDFLELGPVPQASLEMVERDFNGSQNAGGLFCGIYDEHKKMIGIVDYLPGGFQGNPANAFIELLMIARTHRNHGLGRQVLSWVENEIAKNPIILAILLGVQVNNPNGQRFWKRCGYEVIGGPELQPDQTISYLMRKTLERDY